MRSIPEKRLRRGFSLPVLGLGTWGFGGWLERDESGDEHAITAIRRAIDAGITHIDTAERYAQGHAEELVGEAIADYDRSRLFLTSKIIPEHLRYDDVLRSAEASLRRLRVEYLDLYLIHNPNPEIAITETMKAMDRLVDHGMIKNIGLSTFSVSQMEEAARVAKHPIVANQVRLNLASRKGEEEGLLRHAQENDWMFIAFRPIRDVLLLDILPDVLLSMCSKYGRTPAQVAIHWLISQLNVVTIVKCGSQAHLDDVLGAVGWSMDERDVNTLRANFPLPNHLPNPSPPAL